ncbi:glycosyltransferase family 4 protein [Lyngbya confervoides]|uniref:Glycosyltransferase family 4 protein n=1 Tax=Lyngbya confervoides BDU141951 TaxID=1574623 RepID=A0ABD4T8T3_9CYAN|nr:glycosyltransferase family 4 protein [Lyngbya confervoides]MCM1984900.1 glycosyltransferase family 4 protein [Lyngbya confervoides BDU141951]
MLTARWPGYAKGFEDSISVQVVGQRKIVEFSSSATGYGSTLTYVTPAVMFPLFRFWPQVIFTNAFGIWTLIALVLKLFVGWKVIIAYEGSSPGVDFRNSQLRLLMRRIMGILADACISNSQAGKDYLVNVLRLSDEKVFAYPYEVPAAESLLGVSEDESEVNLLLKRDDHRPVFLFVGRIMPRKGLQHLLDAAVRLKEKGYTDYNLLVVGDGEQREELQEFARFNHLDDCVRWVGRVDYDQISAYFRYADVFVMPTLEDTWGVVVLEAMLFGKPVLCSAGAGSSEVITDGSNGYVFEPGNPEYLANVMSKFIDNPTLAQMMGEHSKQVMATYSPEKSAQFLAEIVGFVCDRQSVTVQYSAQEENLVL